jgi:hypothetical protein
MKQATKTHSLRRRKCVKLRVEKICLVIGEDL